MTVITALRLTSPSRRPGNIDPETGDFREHVEEYLPRLEDDTTRPVNECLEELSASPESGLWTGRRIALKLTPPETCDLASKIVYDALTKSKVS